HLEPFTGDFFNDGRVVEEPPATEGKQIAELSRVDAQLVLVFATQDSDEETVVRKLRAKVFQTAQIRAAAAVPAGSQSRIDLASDADHERQGDVEVAAHRDDGFAQQFRSQVVGGKHERIGQRDRHVFGFHPPSPQLEKTGSPDVA